MDQSFITKIQTETVALLTAESALSAVPIFAENIADIEFQIKNSLGKQGIVGVLITPNLQFRGLYDKDQSGEDRRLSFDVEIEIVVTENVVVNRARQNMITAQDAAYQIAKTLGLQHYGQYSLKSIETGEDDGLLVSKITFDVLAVDD